MQTHTHRSPHILINLEKKNVPCPKFPKIKYKNMGRNVKIFFSVE